MGARAERSALRALDLLGLAALPAAGVALFVAERLLPARERVDPGPARVARNLGVGALAGLVARLVVAPAAVSAAAWSARRRFGLLHRLPLPPVARAALAFVATDYAMYLWHRANHVAPALWRLHRVHHLDRDLDATTAARFHLVEVAASAPWRAAQAAVVGVPPGVVAVYEVAMQGATLWHHSALRLPPALDRAIARVFVTPRVHAAHHSVEAPETNANWSVIFSGWDRLHGTAIDRDPTTVTIGSPDEPSPPHRGLLALLALPFFRAGETP